jgi:hypothetical protein
MHDYSSTQQDQRIMSRRTRASKWWTNEELKNISPMHEYHFSLKGKCRNAFFAPNEEQLGVSPTPLSTWHLDQIAHGEVRTHFSMWENEGGENLGCASIPTPSTFICSDTGVRTPHAPPECNKEPARGRPRSTDLRSVRPILGSGDPQVGPLGLCFL